MSFAPALRPVFVATSGAIFPRMLLKLPRAPGLELIHYIIGRHAGGNHDMDMIGAAVNRMEMPLPYLAMIANGLLHNLSLSVRQIQSGFGQTLPRNGFPRGIRLSNVSGFLDPTTLVAR